MNKDVLALKRFSKIIKLRQKTRVASKWLNSLRNIISNVDKLLRGIGQQLLTQASFCRNVYAGSYYLDKRVRMLVPRIIDMISHMDTCQLDWKISQRTRKSKRSKYQKNILLAFNFAFYKLSKSINPHKQVGFKMSLFILYDMFKGLVSESN